MTRNLSTMQFRQLPMFMTAREVVGPYSPNRGEIDFDESEGDVWRRKGAEADESGLTADIAENSIRTPVQLSTGPGPYEFDQNAKPEVLEGQHRVMAAWNNNPDQKLFPVMHYDQDERGMEQQMGDQARWSRE